jgi:hypothetical protein
MTAIAELQAGGAGEEFVALLRRTIRAVGVSRNFPPPEGHRMWDADAVHTAAAEFMADAQTPRRLTDLAVHCGSDQALRARLQGAVRNFLADLGRRTPLGKLVLRINDVLGGEPAFRRVDGRWARAGGPVAAGSDDPDLLAKAIQAHDIVLPNWGHDARRAAPVADRATIISLCGALLDAAGGSLTPRSLARAIGHRLGIGQAPVALEVNALDDPFAGGPGLAGADRTGSEALRLIRATEVLAKLNDGERLAVAHPEYTVRQLAPLLGASASKSHLIRQRAVDVIRVEVLDDEDGEAVALLVMELARAWVTMPLQDNDARSDVLAVR